LKPKRAKINKLYESLSREILSFWQSSPVKHKDSENSDRRFSLDYLTVRQKSLLAVGVTLSSSIAIVYFASSNILLRSYAELEKRNSRENIERVIEAHDQYIEKLHAGNTAWSVWDDTYEFIQNADRKYIKDNIGDGIYTKANLDAIVMLNLAGEIIYGESYDRQQNKRVPVPQSLKEYIKTNPSILKHSISNGCRGGLILLPENPMIVSSCPIVTTQMKGPSRGTTIVGHYLDRETIQEFCKTTRFKLNFYRLDRLPENPNNARSEIVQKLDRQSSIWIQPQNDNLISVYKILEDFSGKSAILLKVDMSREIYRHSQSSLRYLSISLGIVGLFFGAISQFLLEKFIKLWQKQQQERIRYQAVVNQASEGIFLVDVDSKKILEINPAFERLLGYIPEDINNLTLYQIVEENSEIIDRYFQNILSNNHNCTGEYQYCRQDGTIINAEITTNQIVYGDKNVFCIVLRDITERKQAELALRASEQKLSWQATHDALTELYNRQEFERLIEAAIDNAKQENLVHCLCYVDLDRFKIVNDTCGHRAGDELLRQFTILLKSQIRSIDIIARLGGDEFGLLLSCCYPEVAFSIADRLRQSIQEFRFIWKEKIFAIGVSIGLVTIDANSLDVITVLSAADAACYAAKNKGRNRVHVYLADDRELKQQRGEMEWVSRINRALEEDRFCLYYQNIVSVSDRENEGEHYEVLLRLRDENGEILSPHAFFASAERYSLMHLIDRWVISNLFATFGEYYRSIWKVCQTKNYDCLYTVNLSGASINDDRFIDFIHEQFCLHQIPPQLICFEITETVAITNLSKAVHFIKEFKKLGCRFALDDFGSGMSSFNYLKNLPLDYLKIDGQFIKDILEDSTDLAIVTSINQVAHLMGLKTIAEFVENKNILVKLQEIGVDFAQGYHIDRPSPLVIRNS
jgi:diguanylate cyclase (GGDEF)-like protein/PAS domain S-box-containing protein